MTAPDKLALASRVEQAGGPDRELDAEIAIMVGKVVLRGNEDTMWGCFEPPVQRGDWAFASVEKAPRSQMIKVLASCLTVPNYTASIDEITALIAEKLPEPIWETKSQGYAEVWFREDGQRDWEIHQGSAKTPALALCAAFLRALASTEDRP